MYCEVFLRLCKLVNEHIRIKYDHQFYAHFSNCISELIYRNIYTKNRVQTKDLLCYISSNEYLSSYIPKFEEGYREIIRRNAEYFDSPLRITTEMPLMILTNTREVLLRRKKKLKKMLLTDSQSSQNNSSYSSKINPESLSSSSLLILNELSKISYTCPQSSQSSSVSYCSFANIYSIPISISEIKECEYNYLDLKKERLNLKKQVEAAVKHLIIQFNQNDSSQEVIRSKRQYYHIQTDSAKTKQPDEDRPQISNQIKSVVKAQLKKYNIYQIVDRNSSNTSSQLKIRDKAEQLLKNLQIDNLF